MTAAIAPFGQAAEFYRQAGWPPFPLPEGRKKSPPDGCTGERGVDADADQVKLWVAQNGRRNIGVRMPPTVIGIDVDNYDDKTGGADLAVLEAKLGPLPHTFISTSRDDGVSGIRFFTVPAGLRWQGNLGNSIEIIQRKHRYAVVEPSVHPSGRRYRWLDAEWRPTHVPTVTELPEMPAVWVEFLTGGEHDTDPAPERPTVTPLDTRTVLTPGTPCQVMVKALGKYQERKTQMARHDAMIATQQAVVRHGEQGHEGAGEAIEHLRAQFSLDVAGERPGESSGEFQRGLTGAVAIALGSPTVEADRGCCGPATPPVNTLPASSDSPVASDASVTGKELAEPVNGAELLASIEEFLSRFVAYPSEAARIAHTLWIAHTWFMDSWESTPRIAFLSPEPSSGKSRALEVTEPLVPRPVHAVNTTPAYLFRKVSDKAGLPTILYDEIDTVFGPKAKDNEDVRGMLNAGHRRGAVAGRCVTKGKTVETEELPAYCPVALAGLDDLPDTIRTRSVIIRMRRRAPGEYVEPWRYRVNAPQAEPIAKGLGRWVETSEVQWPEMPDGIEDRNADVWEALLAVADLAGGDWPDRARRAAVALVAVAVDQRQSLGIQLLTDLRIVFGDAEVMATETILDKLHKLEESPWGDLRGKPLDARGLASKLRRYELKPRTVRLDDGRTPKGYHASDLRDLWARYLTPSADSAATFATTPQSSATGSESVADSDLFVADVPPHVADGQSQNHAQRGGVADVADKSQEEGPAFYSCQICGAGLWAPRSQERGTCERCHLAQERAS